MCCRQSRRKRSPAYVLLTFPRLLVSSHLLCSTLPWPRCVRLWTTLLSTRPCIHQRFLRSLRWVRSRLGPRSLLLLTVAVPPPWCLCRRSRRLLPSRVGRGGDAKVRRPFHRPPAAPVANDGVPGRRGSASVAGGGLPVHALAGYWGRVLGAVRPDGWVPHPFQGLSSCPRSHPDIVSDISGRIFLVTGSAPGDRKDVVQGCLGDRPRSGSQLIQSYFPGG